jgi:protein-tyrosine-phosphatase
MSKVLFVCTGNTCRSPMAERLARASYPEHDWESAGVRIWRSGLSPWAVPVLEQMGADTAGFASRQIETVAPEGFDHVVLIGDQAQALCPPLPDSVQVHHWDVDDPMPPEDASDENRLPVYAATAEELLRRIHLLAASLDP